MTRPSRRIVTGHDAACRSVVASVTELAPVEVPGRTGTRYYEIWNTSATPAPIDDGPDPTRRALRIEPPASGSIVRFVDFPPEAEAPPAADAATVRAAFAALGSAAASTWQAGARHPYMHRTRTVDYGIVLEGSITLVLDDGEVELAAGDVVVQRGTNHAWANRSDRVCRMAFVLLDGSLPA